MLILRPTIVAALVICTLPAQAESQHRSPSDGGVTRHPGGPTTEGAPASERTDAWLMFDADYVYVSARCWDSAPPSQWVANELRRDTNQLRQNDTFSVMFDTFHDRRNGYVFYTNPLGARADFAYTDENNGSFAASSGEETRSPI